MKTLLLLAASALALAACQRPATVSAKLDCPHNEGGLTLVSAAANGQSCIYRESDGAEVTLTRMAVKGSAMATLASLEAELKALGGKPIGASSADKANWPRPVRRRKPRASRPKPAPTPRSTRPPRLAR
uniref:Uncharacterized protein n=1 Tax=Phenylobacterium glaciei TaxID=2803784 RepID=A0A974P0M6_9CAUL|nr:hypothetical protein JKL49_13970 [Phenylobacterium glaciei]